MNNQQTMLYQGVLIPAPCWTWICMSSWFYRAGSLAHREREGDMRPPAVRRRAHLHTGHVYRNGPRREVEDRGGSWWHWQRYEFLRGFTCRRCRSCCGIGAGGYSRGECAAPATSAWRLTHAGACYRKTMAGTGKLWVMKPITGRKTNDWQQNCQRHWLALQKHPTPVGDLFAAIRHGRMKRCFSRDTAIRYGVLHDLPSFLGVLVSSSVIRTCR